MNKLIAVIAVLLMVSNVQAQSRRSLKDIDRELKQTKSTATVMALVESIAETSPQTVEDVATLGQLMDKYPVQGQKAASKIQDPNLSKAVMKEYERQAAKIKVVRAKGNGALSDKDRQDYLSGYMNSAAFIGVLANLKDKSAIPMLRGYLQDEDLSKLVSVALGRLGDTESMETMLKGMGTGAPVDLSGYGDKGLVRVVQELDKPGADAKRKDALINEIKGSASLERKRMLKDLALNHKDSRVRDRSALALLNSIMVNQEPGDQAFISDWIGRTKNDETGYWAVTSIRVSHDNGRKPLETGLPALLIDVLQTSTYEPTRQEAANTLGMFKVKEAAPYLEECSVKDKDGKVRGDCQFAYWTIAGKIPPKFHPKDVEELAQLYREPYFIAAFEKMSENNPDERFTLALRRAFDEYKKTQGK
ncbi:MAG: hypothetical protein NTY45_09760 [Elusimicrobia bacterium]|nr:hypothetical protein [Elusimicrobiota bacterium]